MFSINRIKYFKPLIGHRKRYFSEYLIPSVWMESALFQLHEFMPWGLTIISGTILFRAIGTLPFAIKERKRLIRYTKILPLIQAWDSTAKNIAPNVVAKNGDSLSRVTFKIVLFSNKAHPRHRFLYQKYNCNPYKSLLLPLTQFPLFLSMTFTIRNISGAKFLWFDPPENAVNGMENEGFMFIEDLSVADPTLILPFLVTASHLINVGVCNAYLVKCTVKSQNASGPYGTMDLARTKCHDVFCLSVCTCSISD
jgi:mitochondrial inner membrane protein COX18